jgi:hypothetical protein
MRARRSSRRLARAPPDDGAPGKAAANAGAVALAGDVDSDIARGVRPAVSRLESLLARERAATAPLQYLGTSVQ